MLTRPVLPGQTSFDGVSRSEFESAHGDRQRRYRDVYTKPADFSRPASPFGAESVRIPGDTVRAALESGSSVKVRMRVRVPSSQGNRMISSAGLSTGGLGWRSETELDDSMLRSIDDSRSAEDWFSSSLFESQGPPQMPAPPPPASVEGKVYSTTLRDRRRVITHLKATVLQAARYIGTKPGLLVSEIDFPGKRSLEHRTKSGAMRGKSYARSREQQPWNTDVSEGLKPRWANPVKETALELRKAGPRKEHQIAAEERDIFSASAAVRASTAPAAPKTGLGGVSIV